MGVLALSWQLRPAHESAPVAPAIRTVRVHRGTLEITRRIAGSITAARFANISAPLLQAPDQGRGLTLTYLVTNGWRANEGDLLAEFDSQAVSDHLDDVEAELAQAELDIRSRRAQQE